MTTTEPFFILGVGVLVVFALWVWGARRRRKAAERTAMRMLAMSETPSVRASRDVC